MSRPLVFISYSHKDEKWKDLVLSHLGIAQKQELFDVWDDRLIEGGEDWFKAITDAIDAGGIGILLVSANSLTSNFILKEEVTRLLAKRDSGKLRLYPIIIRPCNWKAVEWLKKMNLRPTDGRPLGLTINNEVTEAQIDLDLAKIAEEIDALIKKMPAVARPVRETSAPLPSEPYQKISTLPPSKLFVGRKDHLAEIEKRLRARGVVGVVSLKGTAGVGKSALALEAAYRFAALFPDGRYWVDLRGGDAANAVRALLRHLDVTVPPDSRYDDLIFAASGALAGRRALVILDNAEAVPVAECARLLELCATTIVTSRSAIDPINDIRVDELPDEDAMELLRGCGVDVDGERDDALKLITRLGGLALAIEITARRMAMHDPRQSCAQAMEELNESRHLVAAIKLPRGDKREDNIVEAFALSYDLLDDQLKSAFHALGLCAESGAPVEAVARMLGLEIAETRDTLLLLNKYSLASFGAGRVVTHPLLHDYARMCVSQSAESGAAMIERHVRYFGAEIGGAYQRAINEYRDYIAELNRIDQEVENVRLAQTRALEPEFPNPELALEVTDDLKSYWQWRYVPDILEWLQTARVIAQKTNQKHRQANVLQAIGDVQSFRDEKDAALSSYSEALTLFKQVGDKLGQANVLKAIGYVQSFRKEMDAALSSYSEALTLFKQVGDKLGQANVLKAIGDVQSFRDEKDAALSSYSEALSLFKQVGSKLGQANVLKAIGDVQSFRDEKDAALSSYSEALTLFKQVGDKLGQANVLKAIGDVQSFRDEKDAALSSYSEALTLFKQVGSKLGQANVLQAIGDVQSFRKEMDAALSSYSEALTLFKQVGDKLGQANVLQAIGDVQSFRDEKDAALSSYSEALTLFKQVGDKLGQANVLQAIGDVQSFRKEMDAALSSYSEALTLFKQVGDKLGQANVLQAIGDVQSFRDEKDAALSSYSEALTLFKQVGDKLGQANVRLSKGRMNDDPAEFEEAIRLYEEIGHIYSIARGKAYYAECLLDQGETARALKLLSEAREGFALINYDGGVDYVDKILERAGKE